MNPLLLSHAVLWLIVLLLALAVLALARQVGVLHQRLAPMGALTMSRGLTIGEPAPAFDAVDIHGHTIVLGGTADHGMSILVMFVSPSCPVCQVLLPVLKATRRSEASWLRIVLASDGAPPAHHDYIKENKLQDFPYILSTALGLTYQVERLPFAALLDAQGILRARGLINSREQLESLFEAQRRGVPSLQAYLEHE